MSRERVIAVPPTDYMLFQSLQEQVGKLDEIRVFGVEDLDPWYNSDLASSEMAIRGIVRAATLARLGYKTEEEWTSRDDNIARSLEDYPEVKEILGEPNFLHYQWQGVYTRNFGSFADMQLEAGTGPIIDVEKGLVFFVDEVQQLAEGQMVTTLHSAGMGMGFVAETKESFKVVNEKLIRVCGGLTD